MRAPLSRRPGRTLVADLRHQITAGWVVPVWNNNVHQHDTFSGHRAGVRPGEAELLIAREWAIVAGENDYTTDTL